MAVFFTNLNNYGCDADGGNNVRTESTRTANATVLNEEIHLIHYANRLFWEETDVHNREARIGYYRRQDRLEEIRSELAALSE